jgi:hypothetical protein
MSILQVLKKDEYRHWTLWVPIMLAGAGLIALSFVLPDKGTDAAVGFVTVAVPVLVGSDAHMRHARIRKGLETKPRPGP